MFNSIGSGFLCVGPSQLKTMMDRSNSRLIISPRSIMTWYLDFADAPDYTNLDYYKNILPPEDITLGATFIAQRCREYFISHAALRILLSRIFIEVNPRSWRLSKNDFGKPSIIGPFDISPLRFNISHSIDRGAISIGNAIDLGVDIEKVTREIDVMSIAESCFSIKELKELKELRPPEIGQKFFEIWTLKESLVKAVGHGLSLPLTRFSITLHSHTYPSNDKFAVTTFDQKFDWAGGHWWFVASKPNPETQIAVAARFDSDNPVKFLDMGAFLDWELDS
jgi:4'-phosphopantetheinyl transferase